MINNLDEAIYNCKNDKDERNSIIHDYMPFIRSVAKKTFSRYLEYGQDDELSVAMIAFNEAIDSYEPDKGHFLPFCAWVIKRRLIDYIRKDSKSNMNMSLEADNNTDDETVITNIDHFAIMEYKDAIVTEFRRYEIMEFTAMLNKYGITLEEMYKSSPKHSVTREVVDSTISYILSDEDIVADIKKKGILPLKLLTNELNVPRKTLERSRKYIVGAVLMRAGDFNYLNSFIRWD